MKYKRSSKKKKDKNVIYIQQEPKGLKSIFGNVMRGKGFFQSLICCSTQTDTYRNDDASSSLLRQEQTLPSVPEAGPVVTQPSVDKSDAAKDTMTGASKELSPEKASNDQFVDARPIDEGIIASVYSFAKKAATVGIVYLVGYMGWSVAWLIGPVILSVIRDQWQRKSDQRRNDAKAIATTDERRVILARLNDLPSWVFFPDVERCEWLNRILKQVWPNANDFARALIKDSIEPNVAKALAGYKLHNFHFDRVILGTIPIRIGGVKVYEKNVARNEIIMDLDIFYAGDCDITFTLGAMRGGIKDFQIHGMVRIVMKPLISVMPLIGGMQIFFLNNPNIDFNLVGVVDLLDMPGLSDILRRIIVEQVAAIMVLPNKLPIVLNDTVPAHQLKMPEPEGVLRVHLVEAKNLMKMDIGMLGKGKSDPYAIISVGAQQFKTATINNTVNPKWDYWCEACVDVVHHTLINIRLFDWDRTGEADPLGRATIEISTIVQKGEFDTWLELEQAKHGSIHLRLSWMTLSSDRNDLQAALEETQLLRVNSMSTAILTVFLDSAKNLPHPRPQSNPDPFVVISVNKKEERTAVQMRSDEPVWEQGYTFLVSNPENDTIQFKVIDQKTTSSLGTLTYIISQLLPRDKMEIRSQPFALQNAGPESKLLMSMSLRILKAHRPDFDSEVTSSVDGPQIPGLSRSSSMKAASVLPPTMKKQDSRISQSSVAASIDEAVAAVEDEMTRGSQSELMSASPTNNATQLENQTLYHRTPSTTSSAGVDGLGRIQLTLRFNIQRQKLVVIVHKIANIPLKDPSNIPDPYVKLYLLPGRAKESKRKTNVVKDNCDPVYDATFEYIISPAEMNNSELEVTVCTQKGFLGGSPVIGMVKVPLGNPEVYNAQGITTWYDLLHEHKFE
ncbi:extended synaptotagmin-2 isoform X3 [Culicoides brevitarsis]|uniref:extended synaptotagmin-2 isoform X3 n=1 Tax=Culicoides brevitarsis TaxID=469753 RepID=UPI00307B179D